MSGISHLFPAEYETALERELRETLGDQQGLLYDMLRYQLGWADEHGTPQAGLSGDQLRPLTCMLSCDSLSGEHVAALPGAAAVELVHNFSLIHEDVQSGSPDRKQRPTVWWIWGPGQAINAGDGMHALARLSLMRMQDRGFEVSRVLRAMQLFDRSCLSLCEGQHLDLGFQEKLDVGVDAYLEMAAGKSGALMSCAMGLGALAATEDSNTVESFKECGKHLGIMHQIAEDIRELAGSLKEGEPATNVLNKKKLLPIVYAFQKGDVRTKRDLGTIYFKRVLEPPDVEQVMTIVDGVSGLQYAQDKIGEHREKAMTSLDSVGLSTSAVQRLEDLCRRVGETDG